MFVCVVYACEVFVSVFMCMCVRCMYVYVCACVQNLKAA